MKTDRLVQQTRMSAPARAGVFALSFQSMEVRTVELLLVDDDPSVGQFLEFFLLSKGYGVTLASDGLAAIGAVRSNQHDLVLLDLQSSPTANWEVYGWLHHNGYTNIPILALTLGERLDLMQRHHTAGAGEAPFDLRTLLKRIGGILGPPPGLGWQHMLPAP